jgi:small subunit ribosomal protein S1
MTQDPSKEDFASLFEAEAGADQNKAKVRPLAPGERCTGTVIQVGRDQVFVEIAGRGGMGRGLQAYFHSVDLRGADGQLPVKPGDTVEGMVVELDAGGVARLGRSAGRPAGIEALSNAHSAGVPVEGKVVGVNKGGLEVEVGGSSAFCPMSQIDRGFVADPQTYVGRTLTFLVTELRDGGKRVVLSRRAALEQENKQKAAQTLASLQVGASVRGTVTAIRDFGAFVDLGGVEGLIPSSELSHERGKKAAELLAPGDLVEVQVRDVKEGAPNKRGEPTTKITLSLKAMSADPWLDVERYAPVGKVVRGAVTRLLDFGAFVQLAPGIEGLLHISELGGKVVHPSAALKAGEQINVVVRSLDAAARKISLSLAAEGLSLGAEAQTPSFVVGAVVQGVVDRVEPYGVFLQVDGTRGRVGRGLIPNVELGTPRGADTRKLFPVGTRLTAKVLETGEGKLRLSIKAIAEDEERADFDGYRASVSQSKLGTLGDLLRKRT